MIRGMSQPKTSAKSKKSYLIKSMNLNKRPKMEKNISLTHKVHSLDYLRTFCSESHNNLR